VVLLATSDGTEIGRVKGKLLGTRGTTIVTREGNKIGFLSVPDLAVTVEFGISGRVIGLGWAGDTLAAVLTDDMRNKRSRRCAVWVKGWSLSSGREVYSTSDFSAALEYNHRAVQSPGGTMYVFTGDFTRAFDPANGRTIWEAPIGGGPAHVGDYLVIEGRDYRKVITVLDARSGTLLAYFQPEDAGYFGGNIFVVGDQVFALDYRGSLFVFAMPKRAVPVVAPPAQPPSGL
jgi:outer membrane protein assembly factor BamB